MATPGVPGYLAIALEPSQRVLISDGLVVNVDRRRQLNLELGRVVEVRDSVSEREVEDVPAASPGVGREMQVPPDHLDAVERVGKAESDHRPGHVVEIADALLGECLNQLRVWASLPRHRADADVLEAAVDPDRDRTYRALQSMPDGLPEGGVSQRPAQSDRRSR